MSDPLDTFLARLPEPDRATFLGLDSPAAIQDHLDALPYRSGIVWASPLRALRDQEANCFDGSLLAAAALRRLGHRPRILQLVTERDDEHLLAIYQVEGHYGAIAKSNYVGLRYREPIYRSLRELALSYFEVFFNTMGEKSLRGYNPPVDLRRFDRVGWMWEDAGAESFLRHLDTLPTRRIVSDAMVARLRLMDQRSFDGLSLGVNPEGVWVPE